MSTYINLNETASRAHLNKESVEGVERLPHQVAELLSLPLTQAAQYQLHLQSFRI
jgi:hypothetical protein